ncbi:hypothetical protein [Microbacterium lacticum]|uniref:Uncharacterized protein n=1 Tax=Microbacterium lacticum TaxID=33885 RepID=A0A4Y3UJY4_9MICO|nr:hypothetical protein [Microbacterium lacticum]TQN00434.1 hypothetical protein FHX68_0528 [Microbacterium lacticum]GEB94384.1 hypothetical protein MLA01_06030 [Microbacterium lacticum]GGN17950.1 hypothetical protein GCM10009724_09670 [Microbacterium lacticum]
MSSVTYEYEAQVRSGATWLDLPVTAIKPSAHLDRVPFTSAVIELGPVNNATWALLDARAVDPHLRGQVRWKIRQQDVDGTLLGRLPHVTDNSDEWASMFVRNATRTLNSITLNLGGGETMVDDRLVLEDTGRLASGYEISRVLAAARNAGEYVDALLTLTFGPTTTTAADALASAARDVPLYSTLTRVGMDAQFPAPQGASFAQLIDTELSSAGCRLLDAWGVGWFICDRDHPPVFPGAPTTHRWASHEDVPDGVDPIITDYQETITRDGDWADTIVVTGESGSLSETRTWRHSAEGGNRSRGRVIPANSLEPSGNIAASIAARAYRRGHDITITARIALDVAPGTLVEMHLKSGVTTAEIVSVDWDTAAGEMTVHARSAATMPVDRDTRDTSTRISGDRALEQARALADQVLIAADSATVSRIRETNQQLHLAFRGTV